MQMIDSRLLTCATLVVFRPIAMKYELFQCSFASVYHVRNPRQPLASAEHLERSCRAIFGEVCITT
jgi:hypothetical protein